MTDLLTPLGKKIFIGCESSGRVRDCMRQKGHNAVSCDKKPSERPGPHIQGDIFDHLNDGWDMAIFFFDCTYLTSSGLHWNGRIDGRQEKTERSLEDVCRLMNCDIEQWAFENPIGCIYTRIQIKNGRFEVMPIGTSIPKENRIPRQIIQPNEFGEDASKATCIYLKNLKPLRKTFRCPPRIVEGGEYHGRERWGNQTDSGQNALPPSDTRAEDRARTYWPVAIQMAEQWG